MYEFTSRRVNKNGKVPPVILEIKLKVRTYMVHYVRTRSRSSLSSEAIAETLLDTCIYNVNVYWPLTLVHVIHRTVS